MAIRVDSICLRDIFEIFIYRNVYKCAPFLSYERVTFFTYESAAFSLRKRDYLISLNLGYFCLPKCTFAR